MRSSDAGRIQLWRRRRRLALLVGAASLLGLGGNLPARAQDAAPPVTGEQLFGSYDLEARSLGVQGTYNIEGLLPGGAPIIDLGLPETLARFGSGPSGYGLASLAYPGGLLVNLDTLIAQSGGSEGSVPPYPIKSEAFFPAGPVTADGSQPGATVQKVETGDLGVQVTASFPAIDAPPAVTIGSITSASRTAIEGTKAISRTRVSLSGVNILGGVISIDSLVTDLVAAHDGTTGSTAGGTTATGVRFLGLDASLTEEGLVLKKAPPVEGPGADLGGALGDLVGPLGDLTAPVSDLLTQVLDQAVPQVDDVLAQAGIELRLLDPTDVPVESGAARRTSSGLSLTLSYKGREQQALVDLVNSIPPELKPSLGPIPFPVSFLAENHVTGLSLAPASVSSLATPPFPAIDGSVPAPTGSLPFDPGSVDLGDPGFATPVAPLPVPDVSPEAPATETVANDLAAAVPAMLVALALLASPLFGLGSSKLADNVLAPVSTSCPIGLDKPQAPSRTS
ncbi:MAG: choice-of-anchor P family protein [Acidimicrobiales bacterium]